jgi:hypothetical protein
VCLRNTQKANVGKEVGREVGGDKMWGASVPQPGTSGSDTLLGEKGSA